MPGGGASVYRRIGSRAARLSFGADAVRRAVGGAAQYNLFVTTRAEQIRLPESHAAWSDRARLADHSRSACRPLARAL